MSGMNSSSFRERKGELACREIIELMILLGKFTISSNQISVYQLKMQEFHFSL